jgi:peroxiredoxin
MKQKAIVLIIIIVVAVAALFLIPETKKYEEVASIGDPAPAFEYTDTDGRIWRLADLKGNTVFLNFWATWCTTCEAEIPHKEALKEKMQGKPLQMLGILFRDDPGNLPEYKKTHKVTIPTLVSPRNEAAKLYGITGVPETFIIDKDGIVREKIVGPREWDSDEMVAMIEKYL